MKAFLAQSKAEGLRLVRSPFFLLFSVLMPMAFYALFTFLNGADTEVGSVSWAAYSLMSMTAFSLIGTAAGQFGIRLAYERKDGLLKLLRLTPLSTGAWAGAKLASHIVIHLLIVAVMFTAAALAFGVEMPAGRWIACGLWLLFGSIPFLGLGMLIGTIKSADVATAVSNLLYMGISVAGGLWMPLDTFPSWLQAIGQRLPSHAYAKGAWGMLAGRAIELSDILLLLGYGGGFILLAMLIMNKREAV